MVGGEPRGIEDIQAFKLEGSCIGHAQKKMVRSNSNETLTPQERSKPISYTLELLVIQIG